MTDVSAEFLVVDAEPDVVIRVAGELDLATVPGLRDHLDVVIAERTGDVVLELSGVTFLDSTALRSLVFAHQQLTAAGRRLVLREPSAPVGQLLQITGLDGLLGAPPQNA